MTRLAPPLDNVPYNEVRPSGTGLYYLDSHYSAYRMGRLDREVKALIDSGTPVTVDHLKNIQANANLLDAELVLPTLLAIMSQVPVPSPSPMAQALDVLSDWDYNANTGIAEGWDAGDDPVTDDRTDRRRSSQRGRRNGFCHVALHAGAEHHQRHVDGLWPG